jgi:hypothetical protein
MKFRVGAFLAAAMFAAASPTYAQGITFGAKVGINFADLSVSTDAVGEELEEFEEFEESLGNKIGFVAGGFVEVPVTMAVSFAPEVLFTQKGAVSEFQEEGESAEFSINFTQVQVPVLFKVKFSAGAVRPFVTAGPAFGFNTSVKARREIPGLGIDQEVDDSDNAETVEYSLVVGGGVQFGQASIEARYDFGLNDLNKAETEEGKTRTWSILFGYGWTRTP